MRLASSPNITSRTPCEFVALIGASEAHAEEMLSSIKTELEANDLLLKGFPEVVFPIQSLDEIANRCNGQLYQGQREG